LRVDAPHVAKRDTRGESWRARLRNPQCLMREAQRDGGPGLLAASVFND
jgi:hypothetical protein